MLLRMIRSLIVACATTCCFIPVALAAPAQNAPSPKQENAVMHHVSGSFDVKIEPQNADNAPARESGLGRMSIDKQFHGDLDATSKGEMLSFMNREAGSGGYVAMERVTGTLGGHSGSFVLEHNATMDHGAPELNIIVVPDSGTGDLAGISGTMKIRIENGKHFYDFDYALPSP
jgi:Protein of unknown function (DUF3224)